MSRYTPWCTGCPACPGGGAGSAARARSCPHSASPDEILMNRRTEMGVALVEREKFKYRGCGAGRRRQGV